MLDLRGCTGSVAAAVATMAAVAAAPGVGGARQADPCCAQNGNLSSDLSFVLVARSGSYIVF